MPAIRTKPLSPSNPSVLHLSFSANRGGAAQAAWRLHQGLRAGGMTSRMVVAEPGRHGDSEGVFGPSRTGRIWQRVRKNIEIHLPRIRWSPRELFTPAWLSIDIEAVIRRFHPDILHLHWTHYGLLSVESLAACKLPIVWTLHDMWPMTGGCHYSGECERYASTCGQCPVLRRSSPGDLSSSVLNRKVKHWKDLDLHLVAPSRWMATCAGRSRIFRERSTVVIPYGVDTEIFTPIPREQACSALGIDPKATYLLFAAAHATTDRRKGFLELQDALARLKASGTIPPNLRLLVVGATQSNLPTTLPLPAIGLGQLHDETAMAYAYNAADVYIAPSLEDNLPNTVLEALACGTPVVGFDVGGMPDMIQDRRNGRLAAARDAPSLARCIEWTLIDRERRNKISACARQIAEECFSISLQARRYHNFYTRILAGGPP